MKWLSKRKNAALLCFGVGGVLALLLTVYAPVEMPTVAMDGGEMQEMALMCAAPEKTEAFLYVKDAQLCAEMAAAMENISLRRVRSAPAVPITAPIYIVKPALTTGGTAEGFTVDADGAVYVGNVQYRTVRQEDGTALYETVAKLWQQVNP